MLVCKPKRYTEKYGGGFTALSNRTLRNVDLSDGAFRLWIYLLTQSRDYKPTEERLAKKFGVCARTMQSRIRELRKANLLVIMQDYANGKSASHWIISEFPIASQKGEPP